MKITRAVLATAVTAIISAGSARAADTPPETFLQKGEVVAPFKAAGIDGQPRDLGYPKGKSTVLLFFLSSCPTCHKMLPEWNRAYERRPAELNVVGVLMDQEPPGFFTATPVAFPVVRNPGKGALGGYKINKVPMTLRVGPGGTVEDIAVGMVDPIRLGEIFRP
jgi:hypothetical protein